MSALSDLFTDIATEIRGKTGETGTMKPAEFPDKIAGIETGGEVTPDYVGFATFMNGDVELYKMPFIKGYDCPNPLTEGLIETPTKESTVSTNYTYSGWDNNLIDLTEDVVVNAVFSESGRYYTVTFYDDDGTTVLQTLSVAYGSMPNPENPEKDGYNFDGWEPTLSVVTGNASYYAVWGELPTFAGASWEQIAEISETGQAQTYFNVGDTRTESIDGVNYDLVIIGFDHDNLADGSGKAGMTILLKRKTGVVSGDTFTVVNWSTLSSNLTTVVLPKFPEEIRQHIKTVSKECDYTGIDAVETNTTGTVVNVNFDLFPLSLDELHITKNGFSALNRNHFTELGTPYELFSTINNTYGGPQWLKTNTSYFKELWLRQYNRNYDQTECGFYFYGSFTYYNGKGYDCMWGRYKDPTEEKASMIAFCI